MKIRVKQKDKPTAVPIKTKLLKYDITLNWKNIYVLLDKRFRTLMLQHLLTELECGANRYIP